VLVKSLWLCIPQQFHASREPSFYRISAPSLRELLGRTCWAMDHPAARKQRQRNKETYIGTPSKIHDLNLKQKSKTASFSKSKPVLRGWGVGGGHSKLTKSEIPELGSTLNAIISHKHDRAHFQTERGFRTEGLI
jgi:hypothetical protein